jgi:Family of unknown function (DUF6461)
MPAMSAHSFDRYEDMLGEIYCLTFVRGVDEIEALLRMGGLEDTMSQRRLKDIWEEMRSYDAGYPGIAQAMSLGAWTVIIEPNGVQGAGVNLLNAVSRGTEAVSVLRHDYADDRFVYSVDGTLLTEFAPRGAAFRRGAEPDRLLPQIRAAGLDLKEDDEEDGSGPLVHPHVAALRLVGQITGPLPDIPDGPLPSAHIEPWFSAAEPSAVLRPGQEEFADALDAAPASLRRTIAVREVRHLAELLDVAHFPDVAEALTAAERGGKVDVPADSALGRRIRGWLADARRATASRNNYFERHRMTEDDRNAATRLWSLAEALRGALWSDSPEAAYAALRPLAVGPDRADDASRRAAILRVLRDR